MVSILEAEFEILRSKLLHVGLLKMRVVTGSMEPVIRVGEEIDIVPVGSRPVRFDILVFWDPGSTRLICHYLWHINRLPDSSDGLTFVTKSMLGREDLPIPGSHVLGTVSSHRIPLFKRARLLMSRG